MATYLHGYSDQEASRLAQQGRFLEEVVHGGISFPAGAQVLEAGCGVGAQTVALASRSPDAIFTSIDLSETSLTSARERIALTGLTNVTFRQADIGRLPFADGSFDAVFLCFVLEHMSDPVAALRELRRVLRPGGTAVAIETDHATTLFHPSSVSSQNIVRGMVRAQSALGGDAEIGHKLSPILTAAGFNVGGITLLPLYADAGMPEVHKALIDEIWLPVLEGAMPNIIAHGGVDHHDAAAALAEWRQMVRSPDFTFTHLLFRAVATRD